MKTNYRHYPAALAIAVAVVAGPVRTDDAAGPLPAPEWKLVWSDEFDGNEIDRSKWDLDIGSGFLSGDGQTWISGWGNDELEYYTDEKKNAFIRDGMLHIRASSSRARRASTRRPSSRLASATAPSSLARRMASSSSGPSCRPARASGRHSGCCPRMRRSTAAGRLPARSTSWRPAASSRARCSAHFTSDRWPANSHAGKDHVLPRGTSIREFHVYALEWEPGEIRWYIDGKLFQTQSFWWSSSKSEGGKGANPARETDLNPWPAPFDQPFYLIMNLAVGGRFLGNPDSTTVFPAEMVVDYVRVYDNAKGYGQAAPRGPGKLPFATSRRP